MQYSVFVFDSKNVTHEISPTSTSNVSTLKINIPFSESFVKIYDVLSLVGEDLKKGLKYAIAGFVKENWGSEKLDTGFNDNLDLQTMYNSVEILMFSSKLQIVFIMPRASQNLEGAAQAVADYAAHFVELSNVAIQLF